MKWQPFPMLRIAFFFAGGVLLGIYQLDFIPFGLAIGLIVLGSILFFAFRFFSMKNQLASYSGLIGLLVIFLLGYSRLIFFTDSTNENHISKITDPIEAYEAIVRSVPEEKVKSWKVELELVQAKTDHWQPVAGKLLLYISKKNNDGVTWRYGDIILIK